MEATFEVVPAPAFPVTVPVSQDRPDSTSMVALRIETKYRFVLPDADKVYHEYVLPSDRDIQNCGGYIDKLLKYRSPALVSSILDGGPPTAESLRSSPFPALRGRPPQIDLILATLIQRRPSGSRARVSLLDHGCTVAEHFDLLDLLFRASGCGRASELLSYIGLDLSPLALSAARLFHEDLLGEHFRLVLSEGSDIDLPDNSVDYAISVGVLNHVARPNEALDRMIAVTREAIVIAIWVTTEPEGFWALNHSGYGNYFFAAADLATLARKHSKGRFFVAEYVPEALTTQPNSYIGISPERLERLGSYLLVYGNIADPPASLARVEL